MGGINLRNPWGICLAEMQTLCCIPVLLWVLWLVWRLLALVLAVITLPYEEHEPGRHMHDRTAQTQNPMHSFDGRYFPEAGNGHQSSNGGF
jgi:hypothetical protein